MFDKRFSPTDSQLPPHIHGCCPQILDRDVSADVSAVEQIMWCLCCAEDADGVCGQI